MSLLTDLFRTAADDEYARGRAHPRRASRDPPSRTAPTTAWRTPRVRAAVLLTIGVAVLGLLFATTAIQAQAGRSGGGRRAGVAGRAHRGRCGRARSICRRELTLAETTLAEAQDDALDHRGGRGDSASSSIGWR